MHYFHTGVALYSGKQQGLDYGMYMDLIECYRQSFYPEIDISFDDFYEIFKKDGVVHSFYAIEGQVVSTATGIIKESIIHNGKKSMMIEDVCTKLNFRKNGYGAVAVNELITYAREIGCYKIQLNSSDENAGFYNKLGFKNHKHRSMRIDLDD